MQFLNLQLKFDDSQLVLHVEAQAQSQEYRLLGAVSDPQELAYQAGLFVGVHLQPYFDLLPVDATELSIAREVPALVREHCLVQLNKLTKTNEFLVAAKSRNEKALSTQKQPVSNMLAVFSEFTPIEALLNMIDLDAPSKSGSKRAIVLGYLPSQEPINEQEAQLRIFSTSAVEWFDWYLSLNVTTLYCGADFVAEFERESLALASLLRAVGHTLVINDHSYSATNPLAQYEKRVRDSKSIVHFVQEEKSLLWARWLGLQATRLGTLKTVEYEYSSQALLEAMPEHRWQSLDIKKQRPINNLQGESQPASSSILLCEDLYLQRLVTWLPQVCFIKGLLEQHLPEQVSSLALPDIWLGVMRRLLVGSAESTDYDVVVLGQRLELIADGLHYLQLTELIQELTTKTQVILTGHPDWQRIFPSLWTPGFSPAQWRKAGAAFPDAMFLHAKSVFHPCLSARCVNEIIRGGSAAFFSSYHQLCEPRRELNSGEPALSWLAQQNVTSADACSVHGMSAVSQRDSMTATRQSVLKMLREHNQTKTNNLINGEWHAPATALETSVDQCLTDWNSSIEQFYTDHSALFHESLLALNPSADLGITAELRANAPDYLARILRFMDTQAHQQQVS